MKKALVALLLFAYLLSATTAFAMDAPTSNARLEGTIRELEMYLYEGIEDENKLLAMQENFYSVGGKYGKLFGVYCEALYYLAQERFELASVYAQVLADNTDFSNYLIDIETPTIEGGETLMTYIQAREAEAEGNDDEALDLYLRCFTYFDVIYRQSDTMFELCETKYDEGNAAMETGDFEKAVECFEYTNRFDYKNSEHNLTYAKSELDKNQQPATTVPGESEEAKQSSENPKENTPEEAKCEHKETYWKIVKNPTCSEEGSQRKMCKVCGDRIKTATIARLSHKFGEWSIATDTKDSRACSVCGVKEERAIQYGAWSEWSLEWVSAVKGIKQVETKDDMKETSSVSYKYSRYLFYDELNQCNVVSQSDSYAKENGYKGSWQNIQLDYKLQKNGSSYTGYSKDGFSTWFNEYEWSEGTLDWNIYYRYRVRIN